MKYLLSIVFVFVASMAEAGSISCKVEAGNLIIVEMVTPHPKEVLIHRPGGETVWLQSVGKLAHQQITDFENLQKWEIDSKALGTVFNNGEPRVEPVIRGKGMYHLYVAENAETELENTYFVECYFEITE
jgi:hypothetical protein